ncbi:nucleotide-diphospho-sugar transferase [Lipomyces japonicus]|uniref:nucleotide-diphospho-sugar transferase n=1 Tax=Lipomyces japonicus TaxID=56871 RepID=UPI0034D01CEA
MDFQAIILCGPGEDLKPLVSQSLPKALLPIANKPMLYYALEWCQRGGITSAIVACSPGAEQQINQYINAGYNATQSNKSMKIEVIAQEGDTGGIIRGLRDKIKLDFILLPCDFITDLTPLLVIDAHRNQPVRTVGTGIWYKNTVDGIDKKTLKPYLTIHTPIAAPNPRLLDIYHRPKANNQLQVRMSMLWEYPQSTISTTLLESSIYLFSQRVLDYDFNESDGSGANVVATGGTANATTAVPTINLTTAESKLIPDIGKWKKPWLLVVRDLARESWRHPKSDKDTVGLFVVPKDNYFIRSKSISAYFEANRLILKQTPYSPPPSIATAKGAAIGRDSLVGIGTSIDEKTSVKRSIIGADCQVGRECRISGCVIMDGVVIGDGVHLDNCIIANGVVIEDRSRLVGCTVEGRYVVHRSTQAKNEILRGYSAEGLLSDDSEAIEDDEDDDEDDYEESDSEFDDEVNEDDLVESEGEGIDDDDDLFDRS